MAALKNIRLVSSQSEESLAEMQAIKEARSRLEVEHSAVMAGEVRARAEAHARALAEGRLQHENELLAEIEARKVEESRLIKLTQERLSQEKLLKKTISEKIQAEKQLQSATQQKLQAELIVLRETEARLSEERRVVESHDHYVILERQAAELAVEKARQEAQLAVVLETRIAAEKEAVSLLEGKLIAETARAEATRRLQEERATTLTLIKQAEIEEEELARQEQQAQQIALGRIESIRKLKQVAEQRVAEEALAAKGIELQLAAEEEELAASQKVNIQSEISRNIAEEKSKKDRELTAKLILQQQLDEKAIKELDHKLEIINGSLQLAEQRLQLHLAQCEAEISRSLLEEKIVQAEAQRLKTETEAISQLQARLAKEKELESLAQQHIQSEKQAVMEISMRMDAEQKAIDADNECIAIESAERVTQETLYNLKKENFRASCERERIALEAVHMEKEKNKAEQSALLAEADLLQAHTYARQLAEQRALIASNMKRFVDERVQDERFHLELEQKICDEEQLERTLVREKLTSRKRYLKEVETRIEAEKQAILAINQRQIAEELMRQSALETCRKQREVAIC